YLTQIDIINDVGDFDQFCDECLILLIQQGSIVIDDGFGKLFGSLGDIRQNLERLIGRAIGWLVLAGKQPKRQDTGCEELESVSQSAPRQRAGVKTRILAQREENHEDTETQSELLVFVSWWLDSIIGAS